MPTKIGSIAQPLPMGATNMSARAIFRTVSANISRLLGRLFGSDPTFGPQDWDVDGNAGINRGAHFLGTTDNAALVLRTNNIPRLWINGSEPLYASGSGHVGIGFGLNSPEAFLHIHNYDNCPPSVPISSCLIGVLPMVTEVPPSASVSWAMKWLRSRHRVMPPTGDHYGSIRGISPISANASRIRSSGQVGIGTSQPESDSPCKASPSSTRSSSSIPINRGGPMSAQRSTDCAVMWTRMGRAAMCSRY